MIQGYDWWIRLEFYMVGSPRFRVGIFNGIDIWSSLIFDNEVDCDVVGGRWRSLHQFLYFVNIIKRLDSKCQRLLRIGLLKSIRLRILIEKFFSNQLIINPVLLHQIFEILPTLSLNILSWMDLCTKWLHFGPFSLNINGSGIVNSVWHIFGNHLITIVLCLQQFLKGNFVESSIAAFMLAILGCSNTFTSRLHPSLISRTDCLIFSKKFELSLFLQIRTFINTSKLVDPAIVLFAFIGIDKGRVLYSRLFAFPTKILSTKAFLFNGYWIRW